MWLVVKAIGLMDQYECDCARTPICIVIDGWKALDFWYKGFEIWYCKDFNENFFLMESDKDILKILEKTS